MNIPPVDLTFTLLTLALGAVIGIAVERLVEGQRRAERRAYWRGRKSNKISSKQTGLRLVRDEPAPKADVAVDQLKTVINSDFEARPVLNNAEARLFRELDRIVIARNPGWQVMAQVCVGEFVTSSNPEAYGCINSKRVDLLLMDERCRARHALEYQGSGHYQGSAAARDAVKKEALRKAGIGYHEIVGGHTTPSELSQLIDRLVPSGSAKPADAGEKGAANA